MEMPFFCLDTRELRKKREKGYRDMDDDCFDSPVDDSPCDAAADRGCFEMVLGALAILGALVYVIYSTKIWGWLWD